MPVSAQFVRLSGVVFDSTTSSPLDRALLVLDDSSAFTQSNTEGLFTFTGIIPGDHRLLVRHLGCPDLQLAVCVSGDTTIYIQLSHTETELQEVIIPSHRKEELVVYTQSSLTREEIQRQSGQSLVRILAAIPGVQSLNTGSTINKPVIHGLHSQRIVVVQNDQRLEGQQWGNEHGIEATTEGLSELKVIKGAAGVKYGPDALGGVIVLIPEKLPYFKQELAGEYAFQFFHNNLLLGSQLALRSAIPRFTRLAWEARGSYQRAGNIRTPGYYQLNTGNEQGTAVLRVGGLFPRWQFEAGYQFFTHQIGIFSGAHVGNVTDLQEIIAQQKPQLTGPFSYQIRRPRQIVSHHSVFSSLQANTGNWSKLQFRFAWQINDREEYDKDVPRNDSLAALNRPAYQFSIQTLTADISWKHNIRDTWIGETGLSGMTQSNSVRYSYFIPAFWNFGFGWFAMEKWIRGAWELEAGVRLDYRWIQTLLPPRLGGAEPVKTFLQPSGSLGFEYHIKQKTTISYRLSSAWRPPHVSEWFADGLHHGSAVYEVGNPNLKQETGWSQTIAFNHETKWGNCSLEGYTHWIKDYLYAKPSGLFTVTSRGAFPTWMFTQTDALLTGADIDVRVRPFSFLETSLRSSLLFAHDLNKAQWLDFIPPQQLSLEVIGFFPDFLLFHNSRLSIQGCYSFQQTLFSTPDYAPPPPGYFLLHLNWSTTIQTTSFPIELSVSVRNMLNARYRDYMNRFRYYTDEQGADLQLRLRIPFSIQYFKKTKIYTS